MAYPTSVNDQITDAVSQSNISVLCNGPSEALGNLCQTAAAAASLTIQNSVANQQHKNTLAQTVTTACINAINGKK